MTEDAPEGEAHVRLALRPYQVEALDRISTAEARGVRRQLGVAATGLGKTVMFSKLAEQRGGRTLVLAHRDELVAQAVAKIREVWPGVRVGIVKGATNDTKAHVVVASVQTLARQRRLDQLCDAWETAHLIPTAPFDLVIVDEAHHAAAPSYKRIIERLQAGAKACDCGEDLHERPATPDEVDAGCELGLAYDPCPGPDGGPLLLGVTATPDRGDGKGLDDVFDEIVFTYDLLWGINSGYLSDLRGLSLSIENLNIGAIKKSRGDYEVGAAGRALTAADAPAAIARAWVEHAAGRKTIVFTPTVAVAGQVADEFTAAGVQAEMVSGETPLEERRALLSRFASGDLTVIANCAVLTEGFDEPSVSCIVVARPTQSRALYTQMVGRGTRRHPDKDDCLILDVVGASDEHSLVTIPSLFGIEKDLRARNGTAGMAALVAEHEAELVAIGRIKAEEVELFHAVRRQGIAWTPAVKRVPRRYERELGRGLPTVVLQQRGSDDVWVSGYVDREGAKRVLIDDVTLETAQGVAEEFIRVKYPSALQHVATDAKWRKGRPTERQILFARKWHVYPKPGERAGELSDRVDEKIARAKARRRTKEATK